VQAPAHDALLVLDWIMSRHVHEYLDVAGRPVGEGRSVAFRHVQTEMQVCPYAGSRHHHAKPMNVSALRNMLPVWGNTLTMLSWLGRRYRDWACKDVATWDDLSLVTSAGVFLADYLVLRRDNPLRSGDVPLLISALYKACLGFQLATVLGSLRDRLGDAPAAPLPNAAGFHAHVEEHELLIGEAEVCSGAAAMIMQAYDAMTVPRAVDLGSLPPPCDRLEIAWEAFDVFTHHAAGLWEDLVQYVLRSAAFCPELTSPDLPPEVQGRLNGCLRRRADELRAGQTGLVVEVARAAQEYLGPPTPWPPSPDPPPDGLAAAVLAWLAGAAGDDMETHGRVVAGALGPQLAAYDCYEAAVLGRLHEHVTGLMDALGLGHPAGPLPASVLSGVCGRTLRDW
jgi:hypothetical protein